MHEAGIRVSQIENTQRAAVLALSLSLSLSLALCPCIVEYLRRRDIAELPSARANYPGHHPSLIPQQGGQYSRVQLRVCRLQRRYRSRGLQPFPAYLPLHIFADGHDLILTAAFHALPAS